MASTAAANVLGALGTMPKPTCNCAKSIASSVHLLRACWPTIKSQLHGIQAVQAVPGAAAAEVAAAEHSLRASVEAVLQPASGPLHSASRRAVSKSSVEGHAKVSRVHTEHAATAMQSAAVPDLRLASTGFVNAGESLYMARMVNFGP
mmetsp:Transcript_7527/g.22786  ORF Transcript_7527/g.22786 Transcript_7527/m.22786 type:complete len:148 (-) Transcript_7527:281-724(-)